MTDATRHSDRRLRAALLGHLAFIAAAAASSPAADRIYWGNAGGGANKVSFANLDGSGGGDLDTTGAPTPCCAQGGVAIDAAAGRIYWGSDGVDQISFAHLDGSGGGTLDTTGATVSSPYGVAIDTAAGRVYWVSNGANKVSFARTDGTGGADIATAGAPVDGPQGIVIDPAAGRVYWTNRNDNTIGFAGVDGGGGAMLNAAGATVSQPEGAALDVAAGRIYLANYGGTTISFARLDGTGGGDLVTTGATVNGAYGISVDAAAGRVYWANYNGQKISFARLDGTGGGDLPTVGATVDAPNGAALLFAPRPLGAPTLSGGATPGSTLECADGGWEGDVVSAFLFRAPQRIGFQWTRDGADVPDATGPTVTASAFGEWRCRVTAENAAGATSQTSDTLARPNVAAFDFTPDVIRVAKGPTPEAVQKGGSFAYTLSAPAAVEIAIERRRTRTRFQLRGTLHRDGLEGDNAVAFTGRVGQKPLPAGRYRATLIATNAAGPSAPLVTTFRVRR